MLSTKTLQNSELYAIRSLPARYAQRADRICRGKACRNYAAADSSGRAANIRREKANQGTVSQLPQSIAAVIILLKLNKEQFVIVWHDVYIALI